MLVSVNSSLFASFTTDIGNPIIGRLFDRDAVACRGMNAFFNFMLDRCQIGVGIFLLIERLEVALTVDGIGD